jgi:AbrB family looped-hinge helix DNA binding protein
MAVVRTKVGEGGRIVIPAEYRRELGLCVGDTVLMQLVDGEIHMFTPEHGIRRAQAWVRSFVPEGVSLADELIQERRAEAARE